MLWRWPAGAPAVHIALALFLTTPAFAQEAARPLRPVHTYSIVARDAETGQLGVAVQSHWFSVGGVVTWAEPGVGAVATQSFSLKSYGPLGLELMRSGMSADAALTALLAGDAHADVRQVGMVDAQGNVANHTGENSIRAFCNIEGEGFAVQANLMGPDTVCTAMAAAYRAAQGDLAARMMAALEAAQAEGGDIRGQQSAALLVVSGDRTQPAWSGRIFDLRVEDHRRPLEELSRLLALARAYNLMTEGDDAVAAGDMATARARYAAAMELAPNNHEMMFWTAVTMAGAGQVDEAMPLFRRAFRLHPPWRELVTRLPEAGLLPDDPALMNRILGRR
jgi:uncharacterized Ntn-hydrolase superfamily protein